MLSKPLPDVKNELRALLIDSVPNAHSALKDLLPEGSEKHRLLTALQGRLQQLNKDKILGQIDSEEYARRLAGISADTLNLIEGLEDVDFTAATAAPPAGKYREGNVLYRIPQAMPLLKPSLCTVRVALSIDDIIQDIVVDDDTVLKQKVEVSDRMRASLIDVEGNVFDVFAFNPADQKILERGYTQWLFRVTPKIAGVHEILVIVTLLEFDPNTKEYLPRDVSIRETVTIVTGEPAPTEAVEQDFKTKEGEKIQVAGAAGQNKSAGLEAMEDIAPPQTEESAHSAAAEPPPKMAESEPVPPAPRRNSGLRALAAFLILLVGGASVTYAIPAPVRDYWVANWQDTPEAYEGYIQKHKDTKADNPRLEKAYFRKAELSNQLADLREYQQEYPEQGKFRAQVVERIASLETKRVEELRGDPEPTRIQRFLQDFPEGNQLPVLAEVIAARPEAEQRRIAEVAEQPFLRTVEQEPSAPKIQAFLRAFPQTRRLQEVAKVAARNPELLRQSRPAIEQTIEKRVEQAQTAEEVEAVIPALETAGSEASAARVEKILDKKPAAVRQKMKRRVQEAKQEIRQKPDTDRDGFPDELDDCPNQPGKLNGCPDTDNDGLSDKTDACPTQAGPAANKGCPAAAKEPEPAPADRDQDGFPDAKDDCPDQPGKLNGCPDTDNDGLSDKADDCPTQAGPAANKGCPATAPEPAPDLSAIIAEIQQDMVFIKGGAFRMGSDDKDKDVLSPEKPAHEVTLSDFYMGRTELTIGQYLAFCDETKTHYPQWLEEGSVYHILTGSNTHYKDAGMSRDNKNHPITGVSWHDAVAFCQWLSKKTGKQYRLPTEAEWEYAARGGGDWTKGLKYAGSDNLDEVAWNHKNPGDKTHPVGRKKPNQRGLYDMSGNVLEWCGDWYGDYQPEAQRNPYGPKNGSFRVLRGGSWNGVPQHCRVAGRSYYAPDYRAYDIGFRLLRAD